MTLLDAALVIGIVGGLVVVIYAKLARKNPAVKKWAEDLSFNIVEKVPFIPEKADKIQQIYNEKRAMM